jgi:hypothetical protein
VVGADRRVRRGVDNARFQMLSAQTSGSAVLDTAMTEAGLAIFVIVGFLLPVPIIAWLDRPIRRQQRP